MQSWVLPENRGCFPTALGANPCGPTGREEAGSKYRLSFMAGRFKTKSICNF
jgi:hypothetical protein